MIRILSDRAAIRLTICFLFAVLSFPAAWAQQIQPQPTHPQQRQLKELVRAAMQNELADDSHLHLFTWKERKYRDHGTQVEQLVSTPSGILGRVMLIDDKPLNAAQQSQEDARIRKMLEPDQLRRRQKDQEEDRERTHKMLAVIPDAFDFTYAGSSTAPNGHKLTHIRFTARPDFDPPSREAMVFTGMDGDMVVDETAQRIAKIDGTLFKDVSFGWGILGRLYKGGRFVVEQSEVTPSHWETTRMILHFEGKAIFFKSIHVDDNETAWDFQPVPPMSAQQASEFLSRPQPAQTAMVEH